MVYAQSGPKNLRDRHMHGGGNEYAGFEELDRSKGINLGLLRRVLPLFAPHRKLFAFCFLLMGCASLLSLAGPLLLKRAIDEDIPAGNQKGLMLTLGLFLFCQALVHVLGYAHTVITGIAGQRIMARLKLDLFDVLMGLSMDFFDKTPVGRIMSRVENDVETLSMLFAQTVLALAGSAVMFAGMAAVMLVVDVKLAFVTFAILPFMVIIAAAFSRVSAPLFLNVRRKYADVTSFISECVQGSQSLRLSNADGFARDRMAGIAGDYFRSQWKAELSVIFLWNSIMFFEIVGLALVLWVGGGWALEGDLTIGVLVLFIGYIRQLFGPIRALSEQLNVIQRGQASSRRVFHLLDMKPSVADPAEPKPWLGFESTIEFRNVTFSYDGRKKALDGVSFTIRKGERVAVLGLTGSGKTTLASLLCRFYDPTGGSILADGIDIREMRQRDLRAKTGLILQDVFLFPGDISGNVRLGREDLPQEKVEAACVTAKAHEFISALPLGYSTVLSERGQNLSTGQRQLLAFARALAADPEILILDEATSSVDGKTESLIQEAMATLLRGRTSLIIAHRLTSILHADRVLVLHEGRLVEEGTHADLLAAGGRYAAFFRLQFGNHANGGASGTCAAADGSSGLSPALAEGPGAAQ